MDGCAKIIGVVSTGARSTESASTSIAEAWGQLLLSFSDGVCSGVRTQRGQCLGSGSGEFLLRFLSGSAEGGDIDVLDCPNDPFAARRGEEGSDPESVSAIGRVVDIRIAAAKASYVEA